MHLLHALSMLLHGKPAQSQPAQHQPAQQLSANDPGRQGYLPDTTYNPNPNTNIPWSSHNMALVKLLGQIQSNPGLQGSNPGLQMPGNLPYGGLQGGYDRAAQPLRPRQIPFNTSDFRDTRIGF